MSTSRPRLTMYYVSCNVNHDIILAGYPILYLLNYLGRGSLAGHTSVHFEAASHIVLCKLRRKSKLSIWQHAIYIFSELLNDAVRTVGRSSCVHFEAASHNVLRMLRR